VSIPAPKSLILDLLSTLRRGAMPVRALLEAAVLFGISPNSLRVSLARLLATEQVERDSRGRYRLGKASAAIDGHLQSWRRAAERMIDWPGGDEDRASWIGVHRLAGRRRSREGRHAAWALQLAGFRELAPGLSIRPDNLRGGVEGVRSSLYMLGLTADTRVFALRELDASSEADARALWSGSELAAGYAQLRAELECSRAGLRALPSEHAMVESFLLGGRAIRTIALDPLLPSPIVDRGALAALIEDARGYEQAGRACWSDLLARHGLVPRRAPADARVGDATRALPSPDTRTPNEGALA